MTLLLNPRCRSKLSRALLLVCAFLFPLLLISLAAVVMAAPAEESPADRAAGAVHHVKTDASGDCSSWFEACELETALAKATPGDELWMASGVYTPVSGLMMHDFTFTAWVYWKGGGNWQRVFDFGQNNARYMFFTPQNGNGKTQFGITTNGFLNEQQLIAPKLVSDTWVHVAVTLQGDTGRLYFDGSEVANGSITLDPADVAGSQQWLGRSQFAGDAYFNGVMDEVAIFQRALTTTEIIDVKNNGWDGFDGRVMAFHLEEPAMDNWFLGDSSGLDNRARLYTNDALGKSTTGHDGVGKAISFDGTDDYISLISNREGAFKLKPGVALYGGFNGSEAAVGERDWQTNLTILSADIDNNDSNESGIITDTDKITGTNSYHVIWGQGVTETARLDGLTITGGQGNADWPHNSGGGMFVGNGSPTLKNLVFRGNYGGVGGGGGMRIDGGQPVISDILFQANRTSHEGGGVFLGFGTSPNFQRVTFLENEAVRGAGIFFIGDNESTFSETTFIGNQASFAGGGMFSQNSDPALVDTTFMNNRANNYGGGLAAGGSYLTLDSVAFIGNQSGGRGGGMYNFWATTADSSLTGVTFIGNSSQYGGALSVAGAGPQDTLTNVIFSGNLAEQDGGAIHSEGSLTLNNTTFGGNHANRGGAIYNTTSGKSNLNNLTMWGNTATSSDPQLGAIGPITVNHGLIQGGCAVNCIGTIIDQDPQFVRNPSHGGDGWGTGDNDDFGDLRVKRGSPAEDAGDNSLVSVTTDLVGRARIAKGTVDLGAYEMPAAVNPIHVNHSAAPLGDGSSWSKAYSDLQEALIYAQNGSEVWVVEGVYRPGSSRYDSFLLSPGVAVYGGFDGFEGHIEDRDWVNQITVLSGDIGEDDLTDPNGVVTDTANIIGDNSYHVVNANGANQAARLDGLTVTAGRANGPFPNNDGGGVLMYTANPTLENLSIRGNYASGIGGGLFARNGSAPSLNQVVFMNNWALDGGGGMGSWANSSPTLTNVLFTENKANDGGGMISNSGSKAFLSSVSFVGNQANVRGGGFYNELNSGGTFINVSFLSNQSGTGGGGMFTTNNSDSTLANVIFEGNISLGGYGGGFNFGLGSEPLIVNTLFSGNSAQRGGGLYNFGVQQAGMINATFSGNRASVSGGAIAQDNGGTAVISNTILWGNEAPNGPQIFHYDTSTSTVSFSLVQGSGGSASWNGPGSDGGGNIDADPQFVRNPDDGGDGWGVGDNDDYGDLHLQSSSPAKDKGSIDALPEDGFDTDHDGDINELLPIDLDGNPRINGNGVDMGAYEAQGFMAFLPTILKEYCGFPGTSEIEDNDTFNKANGPLCSGIARSGSPDDDKNQLNGGEERDYFYFNWSGQGTLVVELTGFLTEGQLLLYHQSSTTSVDKDFDQPSGNYRIDYNGGAPGRYYVQVYAPPGHPLNNGDYLLKVTIPQ